MKAAAFFALLSAVLATGGLSAPIPTVNGDHHIEARSDVGLAAPVVRDHMLHDELYSRHFYEDLHARVPLETDSTAANLERDVRFSARNGEPMDPAKASQAKIDQHTAESEAAGRYRDSSLRASEAAFNLGSTAGARVHLDNAKGYRADVAYHNGVVATEKAANDLTRRPQARSDVGLAAPQPPLFPTDDGTVRRWQETDSAAANLERDGLEGRDHPDNGKQFPVMDSDGSQKRRDGVDLRDLAETELLFELYRRSYPTPPGSPPLTPPPPQPPTPPQTPPPQHHRFVWPLGEGRLREA